MIANGSDPRTPKPPPDCSISAADVEYLKARGVSRATAEAAGWYTATKPSHVPAAFTRRQRQNVPALIAVHVSPTGAVGYQKRDLYPGKDRRGRLKKWVSPKGAAPVLACHPWTAEAVRTGTGRLWAVEGATRMLALAERGESAVSYAGCYTWQKDGEPLEDWRGVNMGRLVLDVPDADARTNWQVQTTQAARVPYFETRGARVLAVRVPEVDGDEHAGLDDYLGASGDLETLAGSAAPFEPVDVTGERMSRDEALRACVAAKMREAEELPARKDGECTRRKLARWMAEEPAPAHGKRHARGLVVHPSYPQMAEGIRVGSFQTVSKALDGLEAAGYLERLGGKRERGKAASYLLLYPWGRGVAEGVNIGECGVGGEESQKGRGENETPFIQRDSHACLHAAHISTPPGEKPPVLRSSKLVHTYGWKAGRRVVVHSDYFKRYGSKGEETIRHVLAAGCVRTDELRETYGGRTSTLRRYFETHIAPKVADGVFRGDLESVEMAPDWREALERVRERTDEERDNRLQSEKYRRQQAAFRDRLRAEKRGEAPKPEPVPELAGRERVAEIFAADAERDHAARVEEQRLKAGTTAATFISDALEGVSGFAWRELGDLWRERGGKREDLRRAVVDPSSPWTFGREPDTGRMYVERRGAEKVNRSQKTREGESNVSSPKKAPAEVVPMRPDNLTKSHSETPEPLARTGTPNLKKPDTAERLDPFRNTPRRRSSGQVHLQTEDAPRRAAPKVGGIYRHGPECACWLCEDGPAEDLSKTEIGASA